MNSFTLKFLHNDLIDAQQTYSVGQIAKEQILFIKKLTGKLPTIHYKVNTIYSYHRRYANISALMMIFFHKKTEDDFK
jgi:hypothetical protein